MIKKLISKISITNIINQDFFFKLSKFILILLIFILPLYVLPISTNFWLVNKTYLLAITLFLIVIFYLCHAIITKKVEIPFSFISLALLLFFAFNFLSNYLSESHNFGRWGLLSSSHSLIAYFLYLLLFFVTSILIKKEDITLIFLIFLITSFLSLFITTLTIFNIYLVFFDFAKFKLFNTIGTTYEFIGWLLLVFVFSLFILLSELNFASPKIKILTKILAIINIALSVFLFLTYGFSGVWLIIGFIIILFIAQKYLIKTPLSKNEIFLLLFFIVCILFYIFSPYFTSYLVSVFKLPNIIDVRPSLITTFQIFGNESSLKNIFLGTGSNTFLYIWLKNKPPAINQTNFANIRFEQSYNYILTLLLEGGLINTAILLLIIFYIIFIFLLKGPKAGEEELIILIALLTIILNLIYYPAGLISLSYFFIFLALLSSIQNGKKKIDFANAPLFVLIVSYICLVLLIFFFIALSYIFSTKYLANIYYQKGILDFNNNNLLASLQKISLAVNLDPTTDLYQRDLSTVLLKRAIELNNLINNQQMQNTQQIQQEILNSVSLAIQFLNNAINLNKIEPLNYVNFHNLYLTIGTSSQFINLAIDNLLKAINYEKNNPDYYINLAILYDQIQQKDKALEALQKAKVLQPFDTQIDKLIKNLQANKPILSE